jgi:hypothetical protein
LIDKLNGRAARDIGTTRHGTCRFLTAARNFSVPYESRTNLSLGLGGGPSGRSDCRQSNLRNYSSGGNSSLESELEFRQTCNLESSSRGNVTKNIVLNDKLVVLEVRYRSIRTLGEVRGRTSRVIVGESPASSSCVRSNVHVYGVDNGRRIIRCESDHKETTSDGYVDTSAIL